MDVSVCAAQVNPWSAARLTDIVGAIVCAMCGCGPGEGPAGLTNDMLWARMLCAVYTLYSEVIRSVRLRIRGAAGFEFVSVA